MSTKPGSAAEVRVVLGPGTEAVFDPDDLLALASWYENVEGTRATGDPGGDARHSYVRASMVATVDGAVAVAGVSATISPAVDRAVFRVVRAACDVILVGAGTARSENYGPAQVPDVLAPGRRRRGQAALPVIAQVTGSGNVATGRDLFARTADGGLRAVAVTGGQDRAVVDGLVAIAGVDGVITAPSQDGGVDLGAVLAEFRRRGWYRVLCEGGPRLLGDMVAAGLVDELCLTVSPLAGVGDSSRIVAGPAGRSPVPVQLHALAVSGSVLLTRWTFRATESGV